jgi:imidazolonepropionase
MTDSSKPKPKADLILENASTVLTCNPSADDLIGRLSNASVAVAGERILAVGAAREIVEAVDSSQAHIIDIRGKIIAPGFVDCHTHLVFGGSRVEEYAARLTHSAADVAALGIPTGITATMSMTRSEGLEQLVKSAQLRLWEMVRHGTTTVESKSGYGLSLDAEIKMLEVNQELAARAPIDLLSTFLGAHAIPPDIPHPQYVDLVIAEMIPEVAARGLADFCDVYCDEGYFTLSETRRILEAAQAAGLQLKIHTDQYSDLGGSALAAELGVVSADHLNYTPPESMQLMAEAGVVGVVMPLIDFAVQHPHPFNTRGLYAAGLTLGLATDLCPGCWAVSMQLVMQQACRANGFSPEEALLAATVGGARALALDDRGILAPGLLADIQIWDLPSFEDVIYRLGHNAVEIVIKRGTVVYTQPQDQRVVDAGGNP